MAEEVLHSEGENPSKERRVIGEEKYVYVGEFDGEGLKHGRGVLVFKDRFVKKIARVVGYWKSNKIDTSRMVQILYKKGNLYSGYINHKLEKHGKGAYQTDDMIFTGNFKNNKKDGKGREVSKSVTITGQWQNGVKSGFCVLEFHDDKTRIVGCWKNDVVNGYCVIHFGNKDRYEGEIRRGIITGRGKMKYASGSTYEGDFLFKQKHGYGIFTTYINPPRKPIKKKESILKKISGSVVTSVGKGGSFSTSLSSTTSSLDPKELEKVRKRKCVYEGVFHYDVFQRGIFSMKNEWIQGTWGPNQQPSGNNIEHMIYDPHRQISRYYYGMFTTRGYPKDPKKYKIETEPRYIIQSRNKLEQVMTICPKDIDVTDTSLLSSSLSTKKKTTNPSDLRIRLTRRNFRRSQVFYYDIGVIRPLERSALVLDLNYTNYNLNIYNSQKRNKNKQSNKSKKLPTVQLLAERVLWSSVQKWFYDGNSFLNYYDIKKYILNIDENTEWALIRSDRFPRKPIQGRKYIIQSFVSKEYLCVQVDPKNRKKQKLRMSKLQVTYVKKKKVLKKLEEEEEEIGSDVDRILGVANEIEEEPEEKIGRNFIWNFQHGQLVNLGTGKKLILNSRNLPDIEDCQLVPQQGIPDPSWLFDGAMFVYNQSKCLCLGKMGNLTTMVWSSKKLNLCWNLINVE